MGLLLCSNLFLNMKLVFYLLPLWLLVGVSCGLAGCSNKVEDVRLTAAQLAWQPYQAGQVLRFGRAGAAAIRTYRVADVHDRLEEVSRGGSAPVYLGPPKKYRVQTIDVTMRRTDTVRYAMTYTSTPAHPDSALFDQATSLLSLSADENAPGNLAYTYFNWDVGLANTLPIDRAEAGQVPFDTTQHVLSALTLGGVTYAGPVLRLSNPGFSPSAYVPRSPLASLVFYAKSYGVVGFVEKRVLWYRLP